LRSLGVEKQVRSWKEKSLKTEVGSQKEAAPDSVGKPVSVEGGREVGSPKTEVRILAFGLRGGLVRARITNLDLWFVGGLCAGQAHDQVVAWLV